MVDYCGKCYKVVPNLKKHICSYRNEGELKELDFIREANKQKGQELKF